MRKYKITIKLLSPLHLGAGHEDVVVDAEAVHDCWGMPYFPGKRLKGLLYESALEMAEISNGKWFTVSAVKKLFAQMQEDEEYSKLTAEESGIIVEDLYLPSYEKLCRGWHYLSSEFNGIFTPQEVWESYTELRYQTEIDPKTGTTKATSLHNLRVVDADITFIGNLTLKDDTETNREIVEKALGNLRYAGAKRNRGCGHIQCSFQGGPVK